MIVLDPEPWSCWPLGNGSTELRHARVHEGYVEFDPRSGYEQNADLYPDEIFQEDTK